MFSKKLLLPIISIFSITLPAFAQGATTDATTSVSTDSKSCAPGARRHHRGGHKGISAFSSLTGPLALTADQKSKIEALKTASKSQIQPLREQLKASKQQLRSLMSASSIDRSAAESLFDQIQSQENSIKKIRFNNMLSMTSILTPEQRAEIKTQMSARFKARQSKG